MKTTSDEQRRIRAVQDVMSGQRYDEVARNYGVCQSTVYKWVKAYKLSKLRGLKTKVRQRSKVTLREQLLIIWLVVDNAPTWKVQNAIAGPGGALWSWKNVQLLIKQEWQKEASRVTTTRYLKRWGLWPPVPALTDVQKRAMRKWQLTLKSRQWGGEEINPALIWAVSYRLPSRHVVLPNLAEEAELKRRRRRDYTLITATLNRGQRYFAVYDGRLTPKTAVHFVTRLYFELDKSPISPCLLLTGRQRTRLYQHALRFTPNRLFLRDGKAEFTDNVFAPEYQKRHREKYDYPAFVGHHRRGSPAEAEGP